MTLHANYMTLQDITPGLYALILNSYNFLVITWRYIHLHVLHAKYKLITSKLHFLLHVYYLLDEV